MPSLTSRLSLQLQSRLNTRPGEIAAFCQRWQVAEFGVFGSILRDDFGADSDVDVLLRFDPTGDQRWNLFDLIKMQQELEDLFQRPVDLTESTGLQNPYRRAEILRTQQVIYGDC